MDEAGGERAEDADVVTALTRHMPLVPLEREPPLDDRADIAAARQLRRRAGRADSAEGRRPRRDAQRLLRDHPMSATTTYAAARSENFA